MLQCMVDLTKFEIQKRDNLPWHQITDKKLTSTEIVIQEIAETILSGELNLAINFSPRENLQKNIKSLEVAFEKQFDHFL